MHRELLLALLHGDDVPDLLPPRPPWMADGLCREHPEVDFFPSRGADSRPAKALCAGCVVREECLGYALANGERYGVWGGTSDRERRRLLRMARAA